MNTQSSSRSIASGLASGWAAGALFTLISALYFAATMLRASLKAFWFDELYTVYLCRLPSFQETWTAVMHGADFNPPLFYLLTRWSEALFGEGLIATRLPSILGFYILGVCLYLFTARRIGPVRAGIAATAPCFTLAYYYAYEARPHGIVLGWCGLMIITWQRLRGDAGRSWFRSPWALGLFAAFLGALLTHAYAVYLAVPFFLVEAYTLFRERKVHAGCVAALALPLLLVAPLYVRMAATYKALNPYRGLPPHMQSVIAHYFLTVFAPAVLVLLTLVALAAWDRYRSTTTHRSRLSRTLPREELLLSAGFLLIPVIGAIGVKLSNGPYFERYFMAGTVGFALLLAQVARPGSGHLSVAKGLLAAMMVFLLADTVEAVRARLHLVDLNQVEPVTHDALGADPQHPLLGYGALVRDHSSLPILVTQSHQYLALYYYAPPALRARLVFGAPSADDFILVSDRRLAQWAHLDLKTATYNEFFAKQNDFLVYRSSDGLANGLCGDCMEMFLAAGYTLRSVDADDHDLLEHFSR